MQRRPTLFRKKLPPLRFHDGSHHGILACLLVFFLSTASVLRSQQALDQPLQVFVAVEPFEIRTELVFQLPTLEQWVPYETHAEVVEEADRTSYLDRVSRFLTPKISLVADEDYVMADPVGAEFIRVDPSLGPVRDERAQIPKQEALVAVTFAAPRRAYPSRITFLWNLFPEGVEQVPLVFSSPSSRHAVALTRGASQPHWMVPAEPLPELMELPPPPQASYTRLPLPTAVLLLLAGSVLWFGLVKKRLKPGASLGILAVCAVGAWGLQDVGRVSIPGTGKPAEPVNEEQADQIVYALLRNLYHAFDYRDESAIYDTLAHSTDGNLLEQVYLEIRRSVVLEDQGGAKIRIDNVDLKNCELLPGAEAEGLIARCEWVAVGDVTHWGHTHTRINRYKAQLTLAPIDGKWKMTHLEVLEEDSEVERRQTAAQP